MLLRRHRGTDRLGARNGLGFTFFDVADQQFQLLDLAVEFLRRAAVAGTAQQRELGLEFFDVQRLRINFGVACLQIQLKFFRKSPKFGGIRWKLFMCKRHESV